MELRRLKTGEEVYDAAASSTRIALLVLRAKDMFAAEDFVLACHNRDHKIPSENAETLRGRDLVDAVDNAGSATIQNVTRSVVVALTDVEDGRWNGEIREVHEIFA